MKRFVAVALIMVMFLSACSTAVPAKPSESPSTGQSIDKDISYTLEFPSWQATEAGLSDWWNTAIEKFNEIYPNVKINFYQVPYANYVDTLITMFAAGKPPQIVHLPAKFFHQFQQMGWLRGMNDLLAETDVIDTWISVQEEMRVGDDYYGILLFGGSYVLYYNERLLDEAGVEVPATVEELKEAALKTTVKDENGNVVNFGIGFDTASGRYNEVTYFIIGNGSHWTTSNGELNLQDPKLIEAIEDYRYFYDNGLIPLGISNLQARQYFSEEKVAMLLDGPWVASIFDAADESVKDNLKLTRMPFEVISGNTSHAVFMPTNLSDVEKELVWEFYKILITDEMQSLYGDYANSPPPKQGSVSEELLQKKPTLKEVAEYGENAVSTVPTGMGPYWSEFTAIISNAMQTLVSNPEISVTDMLADLEAELNEMMR